VRAILKDALIPTLQESQAVKPATGRKEDPNKLVFFEVFCQ